MVKLISLLLLFTTLAQASYIPGPYYQATQPVSGNVGLLTGAATIGSVKLTDGTNTMVVGTNGNLIVSGAAAVGAAPILNPLSVAGVDGGGLKRHFLTDASGRLEINGIQSLALPSGASTSALQTTGNTALSAIQASVANIPAAPSTAANQTTSNTSLASIVTNTANIPASPSTSALQTTGNTSLASVVTNTAGLADTTSTGSLTAAAQTVVLSAVGKSTLAVAVTGVYVGTLAFECASDSIPTWVACTAYPQPTGASVTTAASAATGTWLVSVAARMQARVRMATYTSGTATVTLAASQNTGLVQVVSPTTANNTSTVTVLGTVATTLTSTALTSQALVTDVASSAKTVTGNSGSINPANGTADSYQVNVSVVSGTTPTLDLEIDESWDSGTTFIPVYFFERITAVTQIVVPMIRVTGNRIRYVWTIGGTTPSFTFSVARIPSSVNAGIIRRYFDRTILPNTLNSSTTWFYAEDCSTASTFTVVTAAGGTNPVFTVQASEDQVNVANTTVTISPTTTGSLITPVTNILAKWFRVTTTTPGVGATLSYIAFRCRGD